MIFVDTPVAGAVIVEAKRFEDERGFFARSFCAAEFAGHGLDGRVVQCSISFNAKKGTLRGMHLQRAPHAEAKLVRCTAGAIYDVIIDLRPTSSTFRRHFGAELSARNRKSLYIPEGVAHGFQTLTDDAEVYYQMSAGHVPEAAAGVRWNDPAFAIDWPLEVTVISERDRIYPDYHGTV